jgi:hypothetical protein
MSEKENKYPLDVAEKIRTAMADKIEQWINDRIAKKPSKSYSRTEIEELVLETIDAAQKLQVKKYPREWERVTDDMNRMKIFGGWIICLYDLTINGGIEWWNLRAAFPVPDPDHKWVLEEER